MSCQHATIGSIWYIVHWSPEGPGPLPGPRGPVGNRRLVDTVYPPELLRERVLIYFSPEVFRKMCESNAEIDGTRIPPWAFVLLMLSNATHQASAHKDYYNCG